MTQNGSITDTTVNGIAVDNESINSPYVFNSGLIVGLYAGVQDVYYNMELTNNATGVIEGDRFGFRGTGNTEDVTNAGLISAKTTEAIHIESANASVMNSGTISGPIGIYFNTEGSGGTVINSGLISGNADSIYREGGGSFTLRNSGRLEGDVTFISGTNVIRNAGTIDGDLNLGTGSDTVLNYVTIHGDLAFGSGQDTFKNSGTLDGDLTFGGGTYEVTNRGTITGDVNLGDGGGTFYGRKGSVDGTITGGAGADTIVAGDDGEIMAGGKGHDVLYGGAGADTFAFASASGSDTDIVHGFNVGNDTIQLAHSTYTHLAAGQTPTFAIGAAATSATDYLFYNASSGVLYYDVDGSGSHAPYAIATFDKGLNLAASNLTVV